MSGNKGKVLKDSTVAQISAAIYYQTNVMAQLVASKKVQDQFSNIIFKQIQEDFGQYIDAQARSKPRSFHHVYEWKMTGQPSARLFKLNLLNKDGFSFRFNYEFLDSKSAVPSQFKKRRHVFRKKAAIMEAGNPLVISPRNSQRLVFESNGYTVFMPIGASVTVRRPGGGGVKNSFNLQYSRFFRGELVNLSIKKSGFQKIFGATAAKALRLPSDIKRVKYSFSPNQIKAQAIAAVESSTITGGII
jgi:hypothetical protein